MKTKIRISREALPSLFTTTPQDHAIYIRDGLSDKATLIGWRYDERFDCFWFVFDDSKKESLEAIEITDIYPTFTRVKYK